jgi:Asp-tRNA(Asn)/Glu-tRNA(Gln) amidotransferase B subunit
MSKGISKSAAKFVYSILVDRKNLESKPEDIVNEYDLWLADEWAHVGCCIVVCLDNMKLVEGYKKGNKKLADALVGRTMKFANMTIDAELVQELMPLIINRYW